MKKSRKRKVYEKGINIAVGEWVQIIAIHPDEGGYNRPYINEIGVVATQLHYQFEGWYRGHITLESGPHLRFAGVRVLLIDEPSELPEGYKPNCMVVR